MTYDLIITDSHVMSANGIIEKNIVIDDGKIQSFTSETPNCDKKIDGSGLVSIPGVIDTHVHYGVYSPIDLQIEVREPADQPPSFGVSLGKKSH